MTRSVAFLCGAVAFFTAFTAIREHSALVQAGYVLTSLERERDRLVLSTADRREKVARLSSPASLAGFGVALGLRTEYTRDFSVVRVGIPVFAPPTVAEAAGAGAGR